MRERILDAARDILVAQGPQGISTRAIAARLGVSHMTLYTYFDNHAAIVAALKQRQRARMQARLDALLRRAETEDVAQVMREWLEHHVRMANEHPQVFRFLWLLRSDKSVARQDRGERMSIHLQHLGRLVDIGIRRGTFTPRDPTVAAATAFSMAMGPMLLFHCGHLASEALRDRMVEGALDATLDYLCGGVRPRAEIGERNAACSHSDV